MRKIGITFTMTVPKPAVKDGVVTIEVKEKAESYIELPVNDENFAAALFGTDKSHYLISSALIHIARLQGYEVDRVVKIEAAEEV